MPTRACSTSRRSAGLAPAAHGLPVSSSLISPFASCSHQTPTNGQSIEQECDKCLRLFASALSAEAASTRWRRLTTLRNRARNALRRPSDSYVVGSVHGQRVAFLARHGGTPHQPNKAEPARQHLRFQDARRRIPHQRQRLRQPSGAVRTRPHRCAGPVVRLTNGRALSFFDDPAAGTDDLVVHISLAEPFCAFLSDICYEAARQTGNPVHKGAVLSPSKGLALAPRPRAKCSVVGAWTSSA